MKSKHRHELKTNELAEWIANFPKWVKQNFRMIICVSIVVILVAGSYFYRRYQKNVVAVQKRVRLTNLISQLRQGKMQVLQAQMQGRDISFMLLQPANQLREFARNSKDKNMAALGLIESAEAIRVELHYRLEPAGRQETEAQIAKAKACYTEAIGKLSKSPAESTAESVNAQKDVWQNPSLMAKAKLGLGLCEEELGNFAEAEKIYLEIVKDSSLDGTAATASAKLRLKTMGDYKKKIVFARPVNQAPPQPAQQLRLQTPEFIIPEFKVQPADSNSADESQ